MSDMDDCAFKRARRLDDQNGSRHIDPRLLTWESDHANMIEQPQDTSLQGTGEWVQGNVYPQSDGQLQLQNDVGDNASLDFDRDGMVWDVGCTAWTLLTSPQPLSPNINEAILTLHAAFPQGRYAIHGIPRPQTPHHATMLPPSEPHIDYTPPDSRMHHGRHADVHAQTYGDYGLEMRSLGNADMRVDPAPYHLQTPRTTPSMQSPAGQCPTPSPSTSAHSPFGHNDPHQDGTPSRLPPQAEQPTGLGRIFRGAAEAPLNIQTWTQGNPNRTDQASTTHLQLPRISPRQGPRSPSSQAGSATSHTCSHPDCDKTFETRTEMEHHERNHGERHHHCRELGCGKSFVFAKDLARHAKTHSKERPFLCNVLGCEYKTKGFARKDQVARHMLNLHGRAWSSEERPSPGASSA